MDSYGVDVLRSRYSYLVSLLPKKIVADLGLDVRLNRRRMSSYTPTADSGLLVDTGDDGRTAASFRAVSGSAADFAAWQRFYKLTERNTERSFGTLIEPLLSEVDFRERIGDCEAWPLLFERPIGETLTSWFGDDTVRGVGQH